MSDLDWQTWNDRSVQAALDRVRDLIVTHAGGTTEGRADEPLAAPEGMAASALEVIRGAFDLSPFEVDVLMLTAAVELDPSFAELLATVQVVPGQTKPTFALALAVFPGAHWSALSPAGSLRRWRLVDVAPGDTLTVSALRIEERLLHFLRGFEVMDERLAGLVTPLETDHPLVPSHARVAERLATAWARDWGQQALPVIQLIGDEREGKRAIASAACGALGIGANVVRAGSLPTTLGEIDGFQRLLGREAALARRALVLDCEDLEATDTARSQALAAFVETYRGALVMMSAERRHLPLTRSVYFEVARPETGEQEALWRAVLGEWGEELNGHCRALSAQFDLSAGMIRAAGYQALETVATTPASGEASSSEDASISVHASTLERELWRSCLRQSRPRLDALAQRIRPVAGWDDLVLPAPQKAVLAEIAVHVRQRHRVYEEWGFANRGSRGLGIAALFGGVSGTGKTMASEVLARELDLDLYRVDLATVVSKYIGETEKNLKRIFDAAELGGVILLFDEADALFGKRSEVKDSHDRYANIEVSYLLQRMEQYRGLAILTTNMKGALDPAFLRRIRFVVNFPFPDVAARAEIWRRIFPSRTPTEDLDVSKLARLGVAGGNIANIALGAAFLAAEDERPITMEHILAAARSEYAKIEKPLTPGEIGNWR